MEGGDDLDFIIGQNLSPGVPNPLVFHGDMWPTNVSKYSYNQLLYISIII